MGGDSQQESPSSDVRVKKSPIQDEAKSSQLVNYLAGLGAGTVSTTIGYPLDVARVRFLFGQSTKAMFQGFTFSFLYSIGKSGLVWPIQKNIHEYIERTYQGPTAHLFSGAVGNVIPGIIFNPCNVIKVRYMESSKKTTFREILASIRQEGTYAVFTKGFVATVIRDATWGLIYFPLFTYIKSSLSHAYPSQPLNILDHHINNPPSNSTISSSPSSVPKSSISSFVLSQNSLNTMTASASAAATATLLTSFLDGARLFQQKSLEKHLEPISIWKGLKMTLLPNRRNLLSIMTGVGRVTITTAFGHLTYLTITSSFNPPT